MDPSGDQEMWDGRYAGRGHLWGAGPNVFVEEICRDLEPGTALDLGCGQGRNAIWLASRGHTVTALDLSPVAIRQARSIAAERDVDVAFAAVDLTQWSPAGRTWDLVLLAYIQLPDEVRRRVHTAAQEAVARGGRLVLVAHHLDNLAGGIGGPQSREYLFTNSEVASDFPGLEIERNDTVMRPTEEGDAIDLVFVARRA